jgi:hypothetical protein
MRSPDDRDFFDDEPLTEEEQLELIAMEHNGPQVGDCINASGNLVQIKEVRGMTVFFDDPYKGERRFSVDRLSVERARGWGDVKFFWKLQSGIVGKRVDARFALMKKNGPQINEHVCRKTDGKLFVVGNVGSGFVYMDGADEEAFVVRDVDIVPERNESGFYYWRQL